jgi:hypothetical protein
LGNKFWEEKAEQFKVTRSTLGVRLL